MTRLARLKQIIFGDSLYKMDWKEMAESSERYRKDAPIRAAIWIGTCLIIIGFLYMIGWFQ